MGIEGLLKAHDPEQPCWQFRGLFLAAEFDLRALPRAMLWRCRMKFTAIRLIKDEHRSMAAVLRAAEYVVGKAVSTGNPPDFKLLRAMLYYLREFPERRHHPNEDRVLFARIKATTHEADAAIAELEDEHQRGDRMLQSLTIALDNWEAGAADGRLFAEMLAGYASFYWAHMEKEETRVLPVAEDVLSNQDWREIHAVFESHEDPMFGEDIADDFGNLFTRIIRLVPPPLGTAEPKG
jgi:hemerythrin-like domain-containing protein